MYSSLKKVSVLETSLHAITELQPSYFVPWKHFLYFLQNISCQCIMNKTALGNERWKEIEYVLDFMN